MSSIPPSAITSASPIFWQVTPFAPAVTCICASIGLLWVLMCGRLATPAASHCAWMRAMLRSTLSMSMTAQGVPYSRAIFAARGGVIVLLGPSLCLFYFFPQDFQFQPSILGRRQFGLRGGDGGGSLVEFLAIFPVEIGVVKQALLLGDLGLQLFDGLRQRLQRVFLVEAEPALWRG